jgi:hypothetical protein
MLILVSSNSRAVYAQNILDLTAQPESVIMHFRYNESHVDPTVWKALPASPDDLSSNSRWANEKVILLFFDWARANALVGEASERPFLDWGNAASIDQTDSHKPAQYLYPVRSGKVQRIYRDASVAHIFFEVGPYLPLKFDRSNPRTDQEIEESRRSIRSFVERLSNDLRGVLAWGTVGSGHLLVQKNDDKVAKATSENIQDLLSIWTPFTNRRLQQDCWERLVLTLGSAEFFKGTIFYRVGRLLKAVSEGRKHWIFGHPRPTLWESNEPYVEVPVMAIKPGIRGWRLDLAVSYRLELYTFQPPAKRSDRIRRQTEDGAEVTILLDDSLFVGDDPATCMSIRYDSHPYDFQPVFGQPDSLTLVTVSGFPPEKTVRHSEGEPPRCPELRIWAETVHNVTYLEKAAYPAAIGTILLFASASDDFCCYVSNKAGIVLGWLAHLAFCDVSSSAMKLPSFWMQLLLRSLGSILVIRSVVIAVRKLPTPKH